MAILILTAAIGGILQMDLQQKQMHLWSETMHIQQQGMIFSHPSNGGNPSNNQYIINAANASATTDNGTILTTTLEGENDVGPTDFLIVLKNRNSGLDKLVAKPSCNTLIVATQR